jgi:membrane-bound ClpP family serine protease
MGLIVTLIVLGLVLLFAEILLIPGVGLAGILGVLCMGGSCYFAFADFGTTVGLIVLAAILLILVLMLIWVLRAKTWKRMSLETNIESKAVHMEVPVAAGDKGVAVTRLTPMGNARFGNKTVEVTSYEGIINSGTEVEVVFVEGMKVLVKACNTINNF